jgi:hypothetical protein
VASEIVAVNSGSGAVVVVEVDVVEVELVVEVVDEEVVAGTAVVVVG